MPLITTSGVVENTPLDFHSIETLATQPESVAIELANDADCSQLKEHLHRIQHIKIVFPSSGDGRGFSLAKQLRNLGYTGKLRAQGPLVSDQFRHALANGFNEVEAEQAIVDRQPAKYWKAANEGGSYRDKLSCQPAQQLLPDDVFKVRVVDVKHHTHDLFHFRVERPASFRFNAGEFVMLGLKNENQTIYRAYSICSATWDDSLEFYSIKQPKGEFTKRLQWIRPGDSLFMKHKSTGSLVTTAIVPGTRLFMHATGTGIAPFLSLILEPDVYEQFSSIILTHTCRTRSELAYGKERVMAAQQNALIGELVRRQLVYSGSATREETGGAARITQQIQDQSLYRRLNIDVPDPQCDRVLVCGSKAVNLAMRDLFQKCGFAQGSLNEPGTFVWERAFVD